MAVASTHRWIALGVLLVRNEKQASLKAPKTTLDEIIKVAQQRLTEGTEFREYGTQKSRLMWFDNFFQKKDYHLFLVQNGDKNTTAVSYLDFDTRKSRDVPKSDKEGGHFTSHVAISKQKMGGNGHLILAERVPGVYLGSIHNHFAWLTKDERLSKPYLDEAGVPKTARPVVQVDGYQSSTIGDALRTGVLQDIEFIKTQEAYDDGLDEDSIVKEVIHQAKWEVKQKVNEDEANSVFNKMRHFFRQRFRDDGDDAQMFVRIKTSAGQIKRTEVADDGHSVLEQAFVHNELIQDFKEPLAQHYSAPRSDVVDKILKIADGLKTEVGADDPEI